MKLRSMLLAVLFVILSVFLSGCEGIQLSPEALMRPPILTQEQTEIYNAAENVIGTGVIFRYPHVNGSHSAFVLHDYDGDGEEEALVFYQFSAEENTRINILDKQDGEWHSVGDIEGAGTNIDNLTFTSLSSTGRLELVAEWSNVSGYEKVLTVLTLVESRLETLFQNTFSANALLDIDRDGLDELILLTGNNGIQQSAAFLVEGSEDGTLTVSSSCLMSPETYEYEQLLKTVTYDGAPALLIDGRTSGGSMISEMLGYGPNGITNLIYNEDYSLDRSSETFRPYTVLSSDIDYDGTVEIPALSLLPSQDSTTVAMEQLYLKNWMKLTENGFETTLSAVVNESYDYYLIFPENWTGHVTVVSNRPNEWEFYEYTLGEDDELILGNKLLSILSFSKTEYHDEFDTDYYSELAETEKFDYYVSLGNSDREFSVTLDELKELFVTIRS